MSIETAQSFITKVQSDEGLRSEVIALGQDYDGLIQLATKQGYIFTASELQSAAQAAGYSTGQAIKDEDLSAVAGGYSVSPSGTNWTQVFGQCC